MHSLILRGDLTFKARPWKFWPEFQKSESIIAKVGVIISAKSRGEWVTTTEAARRWSFFVGDYVGAGAAGFLWLYSSFALSRSVIMTAAMRLTDDLENAVFSTVLNAIDVGIVVFCQPFTDNVLVITNGISSVALFCATVGLSLPVALGESKYFGDPFIISLTAISVVISALVVTWNVFITAAQAVSAIGKSAVPCLVSGVPMMLKVFKSASRDAGGAIQASIISVAGGEMESKIQSQVEVEVEVEVDGTTESKNEDPDVGLVSEKESGLIASKVFFDESYHSPISPLHGPPGTMFEMSTAPSVRRADGSNISHGASSFSSIVASLCLAPSLLTR